MGNKTVYKIQFSSDCEHWDYLINMPKFTTHDQAQAWLDKKNVGNVPNILYFRIVEEKE